MDDSADAVRHFGRIVCDLVSYRDVPKNAYENRTLTRSG